MILRAYNQTSGCECLHSVPLRSPGTQRPAESACPIRSRGWRDVQVGGRSEALIIKMDSAQSSCDGRVSAARARKKQTPKYKKTHCAFASLMRAYDARRKRLSVTPPC